MKNTTSVSIMFAGFAILSMQSQAFSAPDTAKIKGQSKSRLDSVLTQKINSGRPINNNDVIELCKSAEYLDYELGGIVAGKSINISAVVKSYARSSNSMKLELSGKSGAYAETILIDATMSNPQVLKFRKDDMLNLSGYIEIDNVFRSNATDFCFISIKVNHLKVDGF